MCAGANLSIAPDHAGGSVPARRLDRHCRAHHGRAHAPALGQSVIVENIGGAGGSIAVGRVARAAPDGYTIDIGQWDTHVGSIIYKLSYDLQKDFEPIGLMSVNPQLMVAKKDLAGQQFEGSGRLDEGEPGQDHFRQPERRGECDRILLKQLTGRKSSSSPIAALARR